MIQKTEPAFFSLDTLKDELFKGEPLFILDLRNADAFESGHIEGKFSTPVLNIPYFEMIEEGGLEDINASVKAYTEKKLHAVLPRDEPIIVVCRRGNSSAIIASVLKEMGYPAHSLIGGMQAWSHYYDKNLVVDRGGLQIYQFSRLSRGCLSYLLIAGNEAIVIDPSRDSEIYLDFLKEKGVRLKIILETHAHADHFSGGVALAKKLNIPYYLHPYDGIHPIDLLPARFSFHPIWNNQFNLGKVNIQAIHIPGHTLGNQAFLVDNTYLFCGDSIFIHSISRPDLGKQAAGWSDLHYQSLRKLLNLPDTTLILPGHFSSLHEANDSNVFSRTLGELKKTNEGLIYAQKSLEEFNAYIFKKLPTFPEQYIDIKRANLGLLELSEEQVLELETGKNVCALTEHKEEP